MKIGEVMLKMGLINETQLENAIKEQNETKKNSVYTETLGNLMLRKGYITQEEHDKILVEYYRLLAEDEDQPSYVKETAKVALMAFNKSSSGERLAEESKLTILKRIYEYEEIIYQYKKSINVLRNLEQKKVITETIEKESEEINVLLQKIETLRKDLEKYSVYQ